MDVLKPAEEELGSGKDDSAFGSIAVVGLSGSTPSSSGVASLNRSTTFFDSSPAPNSSYNYVRSGFNGSYPRWNNHGYCGPTEESVLPYYIPQMKSFSHAGGVSARNLYMQKVSTSYQGRSGFLARDATANGRSNSRPWFDNKVTEKQKTNQRKHSEGFSDVICGPRANKKKGLLTSTEDKKKSDHFLLYDHCNLPDFQTKYEHARFFMIKSYNEDDVHKSIKYCVWASTPSGNKKLDDAFYDAEAIIKGGATSCPIFLFFSVNTSGQFVGVAEMTGHVDFKKSMEFWQEERWSGFFPVRWHIIKDVPNLEFRGIILENNDNRPVFFSRDTQEIRLPQGLKMLQIFKNYPVESRIVDDFVFYDARERSLQARRSCIPSLVDPSRNNVGSHDSMRDLEEAMQRVELSRARKH